MVCYLCSKRDARSPLPTENARTWNPATEENGASLSFTDDESVDLDRSLSVHEFTLSAEQRSRITAAACLHVVSGFITMVITEEGIAVAFRAPNKRVLLFIALVKRPPVFL